MSEIKYTELDFFQIKENLKNYLKSQDKFKDYNFDGSSISVLLDILAYNTAYNGFYLNMLASEMFLDSAAMRESVLSRAKHLGYTARSVRSLRAIVDVTITYQNSTPNSILLDRSHEFYGSSSGSRYTFVPNAAVFSNSPEGNSLVIKNVELIQGKRFTHSYVVDTTSAVKQRFVIPNDNVDTSTLVVTVKPSQSSSATTVFNEFDDINLLTPNDTIYYLQPYNSTQYEVVFGDGVFGKAVTDGNVVTLDYIVSSGAGAEGIKTFRMTNPNLLPKTGTTAPEVTISDVKMSASGFSDLEDIDSIKLLAPRSYDAQNRAVTKSDYEAILKRDIPGIKNIRVWGGEENDPPIYGKIFCAIQPKTGFAFNSEDKKRIVDSYINPRKVLSLDAEIVEPEYFNLVINTLVNFFSYKTTNNSESIKKIATEAIKQFAEKNLSGFDSDFRHSKLLSAIDNSDSSIESSSIALKIKYNIIPPFSKFFDYSIQLNNEIDTGDVINGVTGIDSSEFVYNGNLVKIADDGKGKLFLYYFLNTTRIVVNNNIGSVDYSTGKITLKNLLVDSIPNKGTKISIFATPKDYDVIALRNQILILDEQDVSVNVIDLTNKKLS